MAPVTQVHPGAVLTRGTAPDVEWTEIEGECVVWNSRSEELHHLDRIASLIFRLCDGSTTLGETVQELAQAFEASCATVERDVLRCAGFLLDAGLVRASGPR